MFVIFRKYKILTNKILCIINYYELIYQILLLTFLVVCINNIFFSKNDLSTRTITIILLLYSLQVVLYKLYNQNTIPPVPIFVQSKLKKKKKKFTEKIKILIAHPSIHKCMYYNKKKTAI